MNIFCIEQNYFVHKWEQQDEVPGEPVIFVKPQSALLHPGTPFFYPDFAAELYCGCELVLRISENHMGTLEILKGRYDSITVGINFTALDNPDGMYKEGLTWEKAKAWDNSSIAGGWIPVTNFSNEKDINFCLYKNRELVQLGNSGLMINNFDAIISAISKSFQVNTGDLIFTGTPVGIGKLEAGDKLEAFIEDDSLLEFDVE